MKHMPLCQTSISNTSSKFIPSNCSKKCSRLTFRAFCLLILSNSWKRWTTPSAFHVRKVEIPSFQHQNRSLSSIILKISSSSIKWWNKWFYFFALYLYAEAWTHIDKSHIWCCYALRIPCSVSNAKLLALQFWHSKMSAHVVFSRIFCECRKHWSLFIFAM